MPQCLTRFLWTGCTLDATISRVDTRLARFTFCSSEVWTVRCRNCNPRSLIVLGIGEFHSLAPSHLRMCVCVCVCVCVSVCLSVLSLHDRTTSRHRLNSQSVQSETDIHTCRQTEPTAQDVFMVLWCLDRAGYTKRAKVTAETENLCFVFDMSLIVLLPWRPWAL